VCVFDQAHSTPKWGWADRGKDGLQKGFTVNSGSDTVVLSTWKINKLRLVRMAEKGEQNNTAQRLYRKHKKKNNNILKTIKFTESADIRKAMVMAYALKRGKWRAGTLVNALRVAEVRSNLHTGQYAGGVPSDHGQRQALVEPLSLPGVAWNVNEFLCKTAQYR